MNNWNLESRKLLIGEKFHADQTVGIWLEAKEKGYFLIVGSL